MFNTIMWWCGVDCRTTIRQSPRYSQLPSSLCARCLMWRLPLLDPRKRKDHFLKAVNFLSINTFSPGSFSLVTVREWVKMERSCRPQLCLSYWSTKLTTPREMTKPRPISMEEYGATWPSTVGNLTTINGWSSSTLLWCTTSSSSLAGPASGNWTIYFPWVGLSSTTARTSSTSSTCLSGTTPPPPPSLYSVTCYQGTWRLSGPRDHGEGFQASQGSIQKVQLVQERHIQRPSYWLSLFSFPWRMSLPDPV